MADNQNPDAAPASSTSASFNRQTQSPLRNRLSSKPQSPSLPLRDSSASPIPHKLPRRRSSMASLATESVSSFRSTTDDLLLPRVGLSGSGLHDEPSALHSAPLFLAIVPAVAGLVFKNGTAIMTDVTLLIIAAVFLNWSIRLPWDWYRSAQAVRVGGDSVSVEDYLPEEEEMGRSGTIVEEDEGEGEGAEGGENGEGRERGADANGVSAKARASEEQLAAASSLRTHEMLALLACFLGPLAGAWLLHEIRLQLSRPSEGLVSNYNLTIFLLASEIRPLSHLLKLIQNRTLHLQRVVAQNPHHVSSQLGSSSISSDEFVALADRLSKLEGSGPGTTQSNGNAGHTAPSTAARETLVLDVRRSLQPDIDALNRAVRRYEKRATLLSMQIDGRLNTLETRMQDTLALAAAAERNVAGSRKGSAGVLLDWLASIVVLPLQAAAWTANKVMELPARLLNFAARAGREVLEGLLPQVWVAKIYGRRAQVEGRTRVRGKEREREKGRVGKKPS